MREREYTRLSPKEEEVLSYFLQGFTAQEIAKKLTLSEETIKSHRKAILRKYGARNMVHVATLYHLGIEPEQSKIKITEVPEIILQTRVRNLLRPLMMRLEFELSRELVVLLKKAMKDLQP